MKHTILERFNQGDLARAYDLCLGDLREKPDNLWLRHRAVLCLLRSGALERADEDFLRFRLAEAQHDEDCLALGARLLKATAFEASGSEFRSLSKDAAEKYEEIYRQTGGHYPYINAATMYLFAGDIKRAKSLALSVLLLCRKPPPSNPEEAYYFLATQAEAYLILGDLSAAHIAMLGAIAHDKDNILAQATTLRQFKLIVEITEQSAPWLQDMAPPKPGHFGGHLFRLGSAHPMITIETEARLASHIADLLEDENVGAIYGAIAAGSDVMFAEAALRRGGELHIVLPVPVNAFIDESVRPLGEAWVKRCEYCLENAVAIHEVTTDHKTRSAMHFKFSSEVAMGLARMRADVLATSPVQLLVWDGQQCEAQFGTAHDAGIWKSTGLKQRIIPFDKASRYNSQTHSEPIKTNPDFDLCLKAMLFVDVRGSSTVSDDMVPIFVEKVLGKLAMTCRKMSPVPIHTNSWGDGLFLTFDSVADAAKAAISLQQSFTMIDLDALGLPDVLALRIGGHYGPVYEGEDPIQGKPSLFGAHVTIAARIEPVTVPGSIFVSESMAAVLAMEAADRYRCEYIGKTIIDPLLEEMPLYSLRAVATGSPASLARRTSA